MSIVEPSDPIRVLATWPVVSADATTSLADLAERLQTESIGAVTVMTGNSLEGIVSERDVVRALAVNGDPVDVWAADVMTEQPLGIDGDDTIVEAAERMLDEGVRHLPVITDGQLAGIVSVRDVLRVFSDDWRRHHRAR